MRSSSHGSACGPRGTRRPASTYQRPPEAFSLLTRGGGLGHHSLLSPEILEPIRREFRISDRVLDIAVTEPSFITRVGTRIAGKTPLISISLFIFISSMTAAGLAPKRSRRANQLLNASSSLRDGAKPVGWRLFPISQQGVSSRRRPRTRSERCWSRKDAPRRATSVNAEAFRRRVITMRRL
jgi:hypothetical protein